MDKQKFKVGDRVHVWGCDIAGTVINSTDWGITVEMDYMRQRRVGGKWVGREIGTHDRFMPDNQTRYLRPPSEKRWKRNPDHKAPFEVPEARDRNHGIPSTSKLFEPY